MSIPVVVPGDHYVLCDTRARLALELHDEHVAVQPGGGHATVERVVALHQARDVPATRVVFSDAWQAVIANHLSVACKWREELHTSDAGDYALPEALRTGSFVGVAANADALRAWRDHLQHLPALAFTHEPLARTVWVPVQRVEPATISAPYVVTALRALVINGVNVVHMD